jgi:hypothetical protein
MSFALIADWTAVICRGKGQKLRVSQHGKPSHRIRRPHHRCPGQQVSQLPLVLPVKPILYPYPDLLKSYLYT